MEEIYKGYTIKVEQDQDAESPRQWDNLGKLICFHKSYDLGDKTDLKSSQFSNWAEVEKYLIKEEKAVIILPVFLYDHSGLRMKVGSFSGVAVHADWDSGQVGFIYATKEDILKNFGIKRLTVKVEAQVEKILKGEINTMDQYLSGDVYFYSISKVCKCESCGHDEPETLDSCGGFYGYDETLAEAKSQVDYYVNKDAKTTKESEAVASVQE